MFFSDERLQFFKPLSSKYREQVVQCLVLLYQRQYSSNADYGQSLNRNQLIEILEEALARSQNLVFEDNQIGDNNSGEEQAQLPQEPRFKSHREQANWVLKQLSRFIMVGVGCFLCISWV